MKSICFILNSISNCGGTERVCVQMAGALANHYEVHILSHSGNIPYFACSKDVRVHQLLNGCESAFCARHPKVAIIKMKLFFAFHHFDVVVDTILFNANLTIPAIKGTRIKHLIWDNFSFARYAQLPSEQVAMQRALANKSDLLVLSKGDKKLFLEKTGISSEKIHQIYNPLPIETLESISHTSKKVLAVGRFTPEKGFDLLLKAWKLVEEKMEDWSLEIWGDTGRDTGNVHETYKELGLKRVSLHSASKDIYNQYIDSSIYVMSSRQEGFPLVLLEAMSYSLPIVTFACTPGPQELVEEGENGRIVAPLDIEALAKSLMELMKNDTLRTRMGLCSYEKSKRYRMDVILPQWIDLLDKIN